MRPKRKVLRREIKRLEGKLKELSDKYEPEICELVAVAPAGPNQIQKWGHTADGRWVSRVIASS